jgi:hypothetical protein
VAPTGGLKVVVDDADAEFPRELVSRADTITGDESSSATSEPFDGRDSGNCARSIETRL